MNRASDRRFYSRFETAMFDPQQAALEGLLEKMGHVSPELMVEPPLLQHFRLALERHDDAVRFMSLEKSEAFGLRFWAVRLTSVLESRGARGAALGFLLLR